MFRPCPSFVLASLGLVLSLVATNAAANPEFLDQWGALGDGPGQFDNPVGVAIQASGHVYVTDKGNHRVQVFDAAGAYSSEWGGLGAGDGQFTEPFGIAIGPAGDVYVTDGLSRVQRFTSEGEFLGKWEVNTFGGGIAADATGNVYVIGQHAGNDAGVVKFDASGNYLLHWGTQGLGDGEFLHPLGVGIDPQGDVWVVDATANQVQEFTSDGSFLRRWGQAGQAPGQLDNAFGLGFETDGTVVVADYGHRVQRFTPDGVFLDGWGSQGGAPGQFLFPEGVAVSATGTIYVVDSGNQRVQSFAEPVTAAPISRASTRLFPAGPNPFSHRTQIGFAGPSQAQTSIDLFDLRGRHVRTLFHGVHSEATGLVVWDRRDAQGRRVSSGVYTARMVRAGQVSSLKLLAVD